MNVYVLCFLFFVLIITKPSQGLENNNGNKLGDVIKNHTKPGYNNSTKNQNEEESLLKQEAHKLLSECGAETSDNSYDDGDYSNKRNSNKNKRGSNNYDSDNNRRRNSNRRNKNNRDRDNSNENKSGNSYNNRNGNRNRNSNSNYNNDDDDNDSSDNNNKRYNNRRNRGNSNNRKGNKGNDNENYSDEEDSNESDQSSYISNHGIKRSNRTSSSNSGYYYGGNNGYNTGYSNGYNHGSNGNSGNSNCKEDNPRNYGSNDGNYGYGNRNYGYNGYGGLDNVRSGVSGPGYVRNFDIRAKRSNNYDDSQCTSQCIFGYLEVLDDSRSPSETLVIKWLQDHLSNDMKRIKALREARRCFARLSTSDIEDGCEFSQSLSKCLNLELE